MYYHVRISLNDKPTLYDAIRECFGKANIVVFKIAMSLFDAKSNTESDAWSNTESVAKSKRRQVFTNSTTNTKVKEKPNGVIITCFCDQIVQYAHSCLDKPTLLRILAGENPWWFSFLMKIPYGK